MTFERQRQRQRQSDLDSIRNSCDVYKDLCTWITLIGYSTRSPSPENWSQKDPSSSSPPSKSSPPGHWAIPSHLTKHHFDKEEHMSFRLGRQTGPLGMYLVN